MEVVFRVKADPHGSPLCGKGTGELGICGASARVIKAMHNATGARVRDLTATPGKLLTRSKCSTVSRAGSTRWDSRR
jgi:xanthine dehydrogenase YagR molybdenum-binding subunit